MQCNDTFKTKEVNAAGKTARTITYYRTFYASAVTVPGTWNVVLLTTSRIDKQKDYIVKWGLATATESDAFNVKPTNPPQPAMLRSSWDEPVNIEETPSKQFTIWKRIVPGEFVQVCQGVCPFNDTIYVEDKDGGTLDPGTAMDVPETSGQKNPDGTATGQTQTNDGDGTTSSPSGANGSPTYGGSTGGSTGGGGTGGGEISQEDLYAAMYEALMDAGMASASGPVAGEGGAFEAAPTEGLSDAKTGMTDKLGEGLEALGGASSGLTSKLGQLGNAMNTLPNSLGSVSAVSFGTVTMNGQSKNINVNLAPYSSMITVIRSIFLLALVLFFLFLTVNKLKV